MAHILTAAHFKPQQRTPLSAQPAAVKLAPLLADGSAKALSRLAAVPWRVTAEGTGEANLLREDAYGRAVRFESASGSLTLHLTMDRAAISAVMEALLGGNGAEEPFDLGERPLSRIETEVLQRAVKLMAGEIAIALGSHFARPFSHFEEDGKPSSAALVQEWLVYRFLVNVFGQSGEMRLCVPGSELAQQIKAAAPEGDIREDDASREKLKREVGRSGVELTVTLGPETLSVEEIARLRPGRMIELQWSVSAPVTVWSGGVAAFEGQLARAGDRLAVRLTSLVS